QSQQFTASVNGTTNTGVTWTLSGPGSISATGLYTAPASITSAHNVTITATSAADPTRFGTATVSLTMPLNVSVPVTPANVKLSHSQRQQFSAVVVGTTNVAVNWATTPAIGSLSAAGLYSAPPSVTAAQSVTVKATSTADPTQFGLATILLSPTPSSPTP